MCGFYILFNIVLLVETKKPSDKELQAVWRVECEMGVIMDVDCPIDGGWSPWGPWNACSGPCDDIGRRKRTRKCNNPSPAHDGISCYGTDQQNEPCFITNCTMEDYRKLAEGDTIRTEALRLLEAVPTLTERCLTIECPYEAIEATLDSDNTWQFSPESVWNALQCVKRNLGCLVVGEWGPWGDWSACGARCGYGLRWRLRKCDSPAPSSALLVCSGTPLQMDECQGNQCAVHKRDSSGNWSKWGAWSACSENCGVGFRRRKRRCLETNTPRIFGTWGTHCRGQHDQVEVCENKNCKLDGGWSSWGAWGSCSQTCGPGKRSRSRTCTRPEPAGGGSFCAGSRTEIGPCHLKPCKTFPRIVAMFNGDSVLNYDFKNKRSTFFHFYVKFLPLSPHGTIFLRGNVLSPLVRLSLQKWHICLDASGLSRFCSLQRLCSRNVIEPAKWHSVLVTVTNVGTTMRLDDEPVPLTNSFSCDPELPNEKVKLVVGERFHGEIQELILNFIPLCIDVSCPDKYISGYCPVSGSNIAYDSSETAESYIELDHDHYLRLPCDYISDKWTIKLTIKPKTETGTVIFMQNPYTAEWLLLYLQNMRMKVKLESDDFRAETVSALDYYPDQWLDVIIFKNRDANAFEVSINGQEQLHIVHEDINAFTTGDIDQSQREFTNKSLKRETKSDMVVCSNEFFIGGVPDVVKVSIAIENLSFLSAEIASLTINNDLINLDEVNKERLKDGNVQVSSKTASISGAYYETSWGKSNRLNLTCLHARSARSPNTAHWLFLDSTIHGVLKDKPVRSVDDGKVLRLVATADKDIRGFYTCRVFRNKRHTNIVTYGVLGQTDYKLSGPDLTTIIAVITTLALVIGTFTCLFIEGVHDIRSGYGFFRDAHFTPEEEAEALCDYIDQNMHLMASKYAAEMSKARARRNARRMAYDAVESPEDFTSTEESFPSELNKLPALPERSSNVETPHKHFRCEPSFVCSSRHVYVSSRTRSSSSSTDTSPRVLCSRLLLGKRLHKSKSARHRNDKKPIAPRKYMSELITKSSNYVTQNILQRFQVLKSDDVTS